MDRARLYRLSIAVSGGLLASIALVLIADNGIGVISTMLLISGVGQLLGTAAESMSTDTAAFEPGPVQFWSSILFTGIGLVGVVLFVLA